LPAVCKKPLSYLGLKYTIVYNYLDVLNLECFDQLIMIATVKQTMYLLIL
jgi:hypothetical protein